MRHEWQDPEYGTTYHIEGGKLLTHAFGEPVRTDPDGEDGEALIREVARLARLLRERDVAARQYAASAGIFSEGARP